MNNSLWNLPLIFSIGALSLYAMAPAYSQYNSVAWPRSDLNYVFVAGTIQKIQRDPPQCILAIDEILTGDGAKVGKTIDIRSLVDTNSTPARFGRVSGTSAYPSAWDDDRLAVGFRLVVSINLSLGIPVREYPIRIVDRFRAVSEYKALREKLSAEKPSPQTLAECKSKLLGDLHKMAQIPFWGEHREGAVLHPRVEEMCEALNDLEAKTGEKIIDSIIADPKEDIHLRAALVGFLEARDYDGGMRRYTDFSRASTPLIAELRTRPKTSQDACALIVLMHAIYRNQREQEAPLPHAGELVREALDPSNPSEYRLTFAKRFMYGWCEPHQTRRFDSVMTLLETEECNPDPKSARYPPPETVGDWLVFHMELAQATGSIKIAGAESYDLTKLHPSARKRLEWRHSGGDPNRKLPPR